MDMGSGTSTATAGDNPTIEALFKVGAHFGYRRTRRHPSTGPFIFGTKNGAEIFDLEKTSEALLRGSAFVRALARENKQLLFVGGKTEASASIKSAAERIGMPYVAGRWIGGTLTNFAQIRSRIDRMLELKAKRDKGELAQYTKRERLLFDREIERLEEMFGGLVLLTAPPQALFVVDPRHEKSSVAEARRKGIPIVALANSDCNLEDVDYPIPGNDASRASIAFFVEHIGAAYEQGKAGGAGANPE